MASITMMSTTPDEFHSFPKLPTELRQMIWDEAVRSRNLDFQRFNAEIAPLPTLLNPNRIILCLTPHDDFVQLSRGYLGLLGACRDSRAAAIGTVDDYLSIHYIARDSDGEPIVCFARVPFNPDGQVCISGLGPAFDAADNGYGARGMELQLCDYPETIAQEIESFSFPWIKNLTIALDPPRDYESSRRLMLGWSQHAFNILTRRMARFKLETVALVDEGWLNERHQVHPVSFKWLHKPLPIGRQGEDSEDWDWGISDDEVVSIPWLKLYDDFKSNLGAFKTIKQFRTR